jgi:hypothetical protein
MIISIDSEKAFHKIQHFVRCQWLTPIILAIQEAEIRRIMLGNQPRQIVHETLP